MRDESQAVAERTAPFNGTKAGMDIRVIQMARLCWAKRGMFGAIMGAGILLSLFYAFRVPTTYTSTTSLLPPENPVQGSGLMNLFQTAGGGGSSGGSVLGLRTQSALYVAILESRTVQENLVKRFDLQKHYQVSGIEAARKIVAADSSIGENAKNGIVTIKVKASSPNIASEIASGYVEELDRFVAQNSSSAARRERIFLEGRLSEIKRGLDESTKALSQFSSVSRTFDVPTQGRIMVESRAKLQDEMVLMREELVALRQTYSEDNVKVRTVRARIAELQRQIDKFMGKPDDTQFDAKESDYPSVSELPALGNTYFDLERHIRVEETLWDALTRQYESSKVQEAREITSVHILDAASVPQHRDPSGRGTILMLGFLVSFFAACAAVLGTNAWNDLPAEDERKRLVSAIVGAAFDSRRWYWNLPGLLWVHKRVIERVET
jgi:uncharacterized protein involved in exopolysaccharide biosynthesis